MQVDNESKNNINKGKLIFKSKTLRKRKRVVILSIIDFIFISCFITIIYLTINVFIYFEFPDTIIASLFFILGFIIFGTLGYIFTLLIIREYLTFLTIYETGIDVLILKFIPYSLNRKFIAFKEIVDIKIEKNFFNLETLYIQTNQEVTYTLDIYDVCDLEKAMDLIMNYIKK
ncbi:MAG: hypothetical protein ACFFBC_06895 [Promethearchaeota archaeon]